MSSQNPPGPEAWQPQPNASGPAPAPYSPPAGAFGQPPTPNPTQPAPPYGAPAQSYGQPAQPYGAPPAPPPPQAYGQPTPGYGYPAAPAQYGYGQQPQWGQAAYPAPVAGYGYDAKPRSSALGLISLLLVLGCGLGLSVVLWQMGAAIGPLLTTLPADSTQAEIQAQLQSEMLATMGSARVAALNLCGLGGLVGWILGIVATATKRGRAFGVWAIIIGIFAPFIAFGFMFAALSAYLPH